MGSTVVVEVMVTGVTDLYGAQIQLAFDPAILQVLDADAARAGTQIKAGPLLDPARSWVALNSADNAAGTVAYALSLLNPAPAVSGDGVLATITFEVVAPGTATLGLSGVMLVDGQARTMTATVSGGVIIIGP